MRITVVTVQLQIVPPFTPKHAGTVLAAGLTSFIQNCLILYNV